MIGQDSFEGTTVRVEVISENETALSREDAKALASWILLLSTLPRPNVQWARNLLVGAALTMTGRAR